MPSNKTSPDTARLDQIVAEARRGREQREKTYRGRALQLFPRVCARCARDFTRQNLHMLTVHHKDGNHDNNPPDGSNWELLCIYCHDNEHSRILDQAAGDARGGEMGSRATHRPFAALESLLKGRK